MLLFQVKVISSFTVVPATLKLSRISRLQAAFFLPKNKFITIYFLINHPAFLFLLLAFALGKSFMIFGFQGDLSL